MLAAGLSHFMARVLAELPNSVSVLIDATSDALLVVSDDSSLHFSTDLAAILPLLLTVVFVTDLHRVLLAPAFNISDSKLAMAETNTWASSLSSSLDDEEYARASRFG